jgi:hypothetical protein
MENQDIAVPTRRPRFTKRDGIKVVMVTDQYIELIADITAFNFSVCI